MNNLNSPEDTREATICYDDACATLHGGAAVVVNVVIVALLVSSLISVLRKL